MIKGLYSCFDHWHKEGTVWLYSDPHFNEDDLIENIKGRPDAETHLKMINSKVGKKDTFICLGDCGDLEYIKRIRGYKVLIMGNHDTGRTKYERKVITCKFPQEIFQKDDAVAEMKRVYPGCRYTVWEEYDFHEPFLSWKVSADNMLFDEVYEGPLFIGEKILLSHEPINFPYAVNLHGHDHSGGCHPDRFHYNLCADVIGYTPVNFNQFMKNGPAAHIESIHRNTINKATKRKAKRNGKKKNP